MTTLCKPFFITATKKSTVNVKHIPGCYNNISDCLSRLQVEKFSQQVPVADRYQTQIFPQCLAGLAKECMYLQVTHVPVRIFTQDISKRIVNMPCESAKQTHSITRQNSLKCYKNSFTQTQRMKSSIHPIVFTLEQQQQQQPQMFHLA